MSNLREEVAAAFDSVVEETPEPVVIESTAEVIETDPDVETEVQEPDVDAGDGVTEPAKVPDTEAKAPVVEGDAPASWSAAEKAMWAKLPAELKAPMLRREKEMRETVRVDGTARKFVESINQTIQPYAAMLDKTGLNPVQVMNESLILAQSMQTGTPEEKAATLGKMIMHFGVDIDALDKYLVDPKNARREPAAPTYNPRQDPALSPLFSLVEQIEAKTAEATEKQIAEAATWPGFEAARSEMADLIEFDDSRGKKTTIAQAYTRITGLQPPAKATVTDITQPAGKPSAKAISEAAAVLARSRKAASSVVGQQRTAPSLDTSDIRSVVAAAANGVL